MEHFLGCRMNYKALHCSVNEIFLECSMNYKVLHRSLNGIFLECRMNYKALHRSLQVMHLAQMKYDVHLNHYKSFACLL